MLRDAKMSKQFLVAELFPGSSFSFGKHVLHSVAYRCEGVIYISARNVALHDDFRNHRVVDEFLQPRNNDDGSCD